MTGFCLEKLTHDFPMYKLNEDVIKDLQYGFKAISKEDDPKKLPSISTQVGGSVDSMIGIQYLRYHPRLIFQLPSGLNL